MTKDFKIDVYNTQLSKYLAFNRQFQIDDTYSHRLESQFESLQDWSLFHDVHEVEEWFLNKRAKCPMEVIDSPLNEVKGWHIDEKTGEISHNSGEFFKIHGVRVAFTTDREVGGNGWDQPILTQIGFDGGLLGIIRQRIDGIPHYLIEAKAEPGNYEKLQLSPTLQATFSNLKAAHKGRRPHFADYFEHPDNFDFKVLYDAWLSEDGGRLHLKRNRGMLIEIPEGYKIEIPNDNFIWLSLYQIKELLNKNAWVNPHIRGIIAHV